MPIGTENFLASEPEVEFPKDIDGQRRVEELRRHFVEYLGLKSPEEAERIEFRRAADLPGEYGEQYRFLNDGRLAETMIAVIPDEMWAKGSQPSESSAENGLISFRKGYFEGTDGKKDGTVAGGAGAEESTENGMRDRVAWMTHELGHCQRYQDAKDEYERANEEPAFQEIDLPHYPNNKVEEHAFGQQFTYLREKGVGRETVAAMLKDEYDENEFRFLNRVLDRIYG